MKLCRQTGQEVESNMAESVTGLTFSLGLSIVVSLLHWIQTCTSAHALANQVVARQQLLANEIVCGEKSTVVC